MQNLLDPAILFFIFGVLAGAVRSNLEIPPAIAKFLSLYLLMALGLKGGFALSQSGFNSTVALALSAAIIMATIVPLLGYWLLKKSLPRFDAAALAASYGSVSAVTFLTAMQYLETHGMPFGGHMVAAMVVMESPAIIIAVILANTIRHKQANQKSDPAASNMAVSKILHESLTNGAHFLLIGSMVIGYLTGDAGKSMMQPFSVDLFKGMLAFFLLDMGLMVAKNFGAIRGKSAVLIGYASLGPFVHAAIALGLAALLGLNAADAALLMVLSASASYIVVPAVLRFAIPEANPSLYFGLALGVTFPINILLGIPLYAFCAKWLLG